MAWQRNEGHLPPQCEVLDDDGNVTGYRNVHVRLRGGFDSKKAGHAPWPSGGSRPPTRWTLLRHDFDILEFEPV